MKPKTKVKKFKDKSLKKYEEAEKWKTIRKEKKDLQQN